MMIYRRIKTYLKENNQLNYFYLKTALYLVAVIISAIAIPVTIHYISIENQEIE